MKWRLRAHHQGQTMCRRAFQLGSGEYTAKHNRFITKRDQSKQQVKKLINLFFLFVLTQIPGIEPSPKTEPSVLDLLPSSCGWANTAKTPRWQWMECLGRTDTSTTMRLNNWLTNPRDRLRTDIIFDVNGRLVTTSRAGGRPRYHYIR